MLSMGWGNVAGARHTVRILSPLSFFFFFHYFCLNFVVFLREIGAPEGRVERTN